MSVAKPFPAPASSTSSTVSDAAENKIRMLPQSIDAEKGVLSSILLNPADVVGSAIDKIHPDVFYIPAHRTLYEILVELWDKQKAIDHITLTQVLMDRKLLDQLGGPAFLSDLYSFVPSSANVEYYMDILREKYILRQIILICNECTNLSYEQSDSAESLLDEVEQKIFKIAQERSSNQHFDMEREVLAAISELERLHQNRGQVTGLATGFRDLDSLTSGLHAAEMFVVAARPSMGKTSFAMNIAEHVALELQKPVAVFSLEMSTQQLVQRLLCSVAKLNLQSVRNGFLKVNDFSKLMATSQKLTESKFFIDDTPSISILELRAKARRLKAQHDIQLIVIDYLQLLRSSSRRAQDNRQIEIAEISSGIKALAKELNIPIVVLAQLNRNPESRTGESKGRPRLSDLRESGSIEQDADVVGLLVREEYYAENDEQREETEGRATLIIAKQRNGPVGDVPLTFIKEYTRFTNAAKPDKEHE